MATEREEVIVRMGMDTSPMEKSAAKADDFMQRFSTKLGHHIDRTLMGIFGLNLVDLVKKQLEDLVDYASKEIAKLWYSDQILRGFGGVLETQRQLLRKDVADRDAAAKAREKALTEAAKERQKLLDEMAKVGEQQFEKRASLQEKIKKTTEEIARLQKEIAHADLNSNATLQATIDLKKSQMHLEDLMEKKRTEEEKAREAQYKRNAPLHEQLSQRLKSGDFDRQLQRIAQLEEDARLSSSLGNISRARTDMDIARGMRNDIRSQLLNEQRAASNESPAMKVANDLADIFAPIKDGSGMPVRVMDSD